MKTFTNISNAAIAKMLGLELVGRECVIQKAEDAHERYLVAQIKSLSYSAVSCEFQFWPDRFVVCQRSGRAVILHTQNSISLP